MTRPLVAEFIAICFVLCTVLGQPDLATAAELDCGDLGAVASGRPDPSLRPAAESGIRAFWCEQYDGDGVATRMGPYHEQYPNGQLHLRAAYVDSRLAGPVEFRHQDGTLFARGFLEKGEWSGSFAIFHEGGTVWFEAQFEAGRLDGPVRTRYPDGALESETRFQGGREDGLARSFYPTSVGGRLKSEAQIEADEIVGVHRLLDRNGNRLRLIDRSDGPPTWRTEMAEPAASDFESTWQTGAPASLAQSPILKRAAESTSND